LPQFAEQSSSFSVLQPAGQQPSPRLQVVIGVNVHTSVHVPALLSTSEVQTLPSSHEVGQAPG
jgi:hypothetical protein